MSDECGAQSGKGDLIDAPAAAPVKVKPTRRRRAKADAKRKGQIDLQALLSEPLSVLKEGNPGKMPPPKPMRPEGLPSPEGIYAIKDRKK